MEFKDYLLIITTSSSIISLIISWYRDFIHKPNLKVNLNQIVLLPPDKDIHSEISIEILADIIINKKEIPALNEAKMNYRLNEFIKDFSEKENIIQGIRNWLLFMKNNGQNAIDFKIPDSMISTFINFERLNFPMYVPVNIYNKGKATGEINELFISLTDCNNSENVLFYQSLLTIKDTEIIKHKFENPEIDYMDKLFPGVSIKPNDSVRCDLFFIKVNEIKGLDISKSFFQIGKYDVKLVGFNSLNKKVLESNTFELVINNKTIESIFSGTKIIRKSDSIENVLLKEIESNYLNFWNSLNKKIVVLFKK